jgi:predicted esterase
MTTGGKDAVVPSASCPRLAEKLKALGRPVTLFHRPDGGHATTYADTVEAFTAVIDRLPEADADRGR